MAELLDIEELYERYGPMVIRRCRAILHNEDDAIDAAQDVFVRVLECQDRLTDEAPSSLLYRMATNICLNVIRTRSRRPQTEGGDLVETIAHLPGRDLVETRNFLERIFGRKKVSTREIAAMYWLEERTHQEVADAVGMSVSGVRKRLRKVRQSLTEQGLTL